MSVHRLTKGANAALPTVGLVFRVDWDHVRGPAEMDVLAVVLGPDGRVRTDDDLVFWGSPRHPSGAVRLAGRQAPGQQSVEVDLAALDERVGAVLILLSADGAAVGRTSDVEWSLTDGVTGSPLATAALTGTTSETAVLLAELYRRDGGWKVRAVGQGWDAGLSALVTEYGVVVEEPAATTSPAPEPIAPPSGALPLEVVLSWEVARPGRIVTLDADAVLLDAEGVVLGSVGSRAGAVAGIEAPRGTPLAWTFTVRRDLLEAAVTSVAFSLTSAGGQRFTEVASASCTGAGDGPAFEAVFEGRQRRTGLVLAELGRNGRGWTMRRVGRFADARTGRALFDSSVTRSDG